MLKKDEFAAFFSQVQNLMLLRRAGIALPTGNIAAIFSLLDSNEDQQLPVERVVCGLQKLHGSARSIDVAVLRRDIMELRLSLEGADDSNDGNDKNKASSLGNHLRKRPKSGRAKRSRQPCVVAAISESDEEKPEFVKNSLKDEAKQASPADVISAAALNLTANRRSLHQVLAELEGLGGQRSVLPSQRASLVGRLSWATPIDVGETSAADALAAEDLTSPTNAPRVGG